MLRRILTLFFVSGALGLGYQVLWSKLVLLFVGVSSWSYAIVLAAFMCGLALGSRALGGVADRAPSPLKLFGFLELGIGAYAVMYPKLTDLAGHAYLGMAAATSQHAGDMRLLALKAGVAGVLLIPPTFLMGGTYPALVRHASVELGHVGRRASQLYAINAAGAVLGSLGMAMFVLPFLGLHASLMMLAMGNAIVGAAAVLLSRRPAGVAAAAEEARAARETDVPLDEPAVDPVRLGVFIAFAAGFLSFTLEVAWTRAFAMGMGSSTQSFAAILAAFITGIAAGSALLSRIESRLRRPIAVFGWAQIVTGLLVLLPLPLYQYLPWAIGRLARGLPATEAGYQAWGAIKLGACLGIMLLPCLGMGLSIPLIVKSVSRRLERVGSDTGLVYAWNTAGNVLGALTAGMLLLPALGVERLVAWSAVALVGAGAVALVLGSPRSEARRTGTIAATGMLAAVVLALVLPSWNPAWFSVAAFRRLQIGTFAISVEGIAGRIVRYYRDDPAANVMVLEGRGETAGHLALLVNGKPDASNLGDQPTQMLLGHLPLLLHPDSKSVMVIGLASGITSGAVLRHPVEKLDVVDIVRCMPEASAFFDEWSGKPLSDPRTTFIADDARSWMLSTKERYDVVISEPSNPWTAGTGSLFSTDFYREASRHLAPGGLYVQWLQAYELSDELLAATVRSFRTVFPHVTLWETASLDIIMLGSMEPVGADPARMAERMAVPGVAQHLNGLAITEPNQILFLQRFSAASVDWIAATATLENTDDNLLLEYRAPRDLFMVLAPAVLTRVDERRAASPSLPWTVQIRAGTEDPLLLPQVMQRRSFGTSELLAGWLAAVSRVQGVPYDSLPANLRAALPPTIGEPMSNDELVAAIREAVATQDIERLTKLLAGERTAIALAGMMSPQAAESWNATLSELAASTSGRAAASLRLVQCDALGAAGRADEARAALAAAEATNPPPTVEEVLLRACRLDPDAGCDAAAKRLVDRTGDQRLERFLELRAARH